MFDYYERFTERARTVASGAEKYARYFDSDCVGTEHLLLALALSEESLPERILTSEGYGASKICEYLSEGIEQHAGQIPFSLGTEKALELALSESLAHGGKEVDDIDILLGILRLNDDNAAVTMLQKLNNGDNAVDSLRKAISKQLASSSATPIETEPECVILKISVPKKSVADDGFSVLKRIIRSLAKWPVKDLRRFLKLVEMSRVERDQVLRSIP